MALKNKLIKLKRRCGSCEEKQKNTSKKMPLKFSVLFNNKKMERLKVGLQPKSQAKKARAEAKKLEFTSWKMNWKILGAAKMDCRRLLLSALPSSFS